MARLTRPAKPTRPPPRSNKLKNASGYAKRQARKGAAGVSTDVYEYAPEKVRRSKVAMDLDREEEEGFPLGSDADEDSRQQLRARLIGENADDEMIASEDDEEIDSDAAFEESDEERYAGFFSSKKAKKPSKTQKSSVRFAEVNLNEDDDMEGPAEADAEDVDKDSDAEESGEDDEFINVLDILDGKGIPEDDQEAVSPSSIPLRPSQDDDEEEDEEEGSDSDEDVSEPEDIDDDDEPSHEALDELNAFISKLDPTASKRKLPVEENVPDARPLKRRMLKERTEGGEENEFRARTSDAKLNLDDLLAPLDSQSSNLLSLKKSTKALTSTSKTRTLAAPLQQRMQERLDREAAYEQTKGEVDKWQPTMKRIQEAEHLSFPLQAKPTGRVSNLELAAKFKPTTAMESAVDALLKSAKLRDEDILETEETMLKENEVSVEEVAQRRGELRKMRELMFRAEIKAKRVSKIKSKTYRKIKRKEKERMGEQLDAGDSENEEDRLKRELDRAKERATLRHKNTGKWAKQMKGRAGWDTEGRKGIEEMLDRGEKLRRKIAGRDSDASDDDGSDGDSEDDGVDMEGIRQGALDEIAKLGDGPGLEGKSSKVFEMKFMKDAMARQQLTTDQLVNDFMKELGDGSEDIEALATDDASVIVSRAGGRITYRPGPSGISSNATTISDIAPTPSPSIVLDSPPIPSRISTLLSAPSTEEVNPWLVPQDNVPGSSKGPRKHEVIVDKNSAAVEKSKNKLKKQEKKKESEKAKVKDDAEVEISLDNTLMLAPAPPTTKKAKKSKTTIANEEHLSDSDIDSEVEAQEVALSRKGKGKAKAAFEQRDLVALAFAGDNVVRDFKEAKRREIEADAPTEVDTTIPGWGSWGGSGVRKAPTKPQFIKKVAGIDPKSRADYNKAHVIISEKRDKKAAKYQLKDLPYPYTSKAQFDKKMEQPLGLEWNTRVGFQRGTMPKVIKKVGVVIDPLEKLF